MSAKYHIQNRQTVTFFMRLHPALSRKRARGCSYFPLSTGGVVWVREQLPLSPGGRGQGEGSNPLPKHLPKGIHHDVGYGRRQQVAGAGEEDAIYQPGDRLVDNAGSQTGEQIPLHQAGVGPQMP